MSQEINK